MIASSPSGLSAQRIPIAIVADQVLTLHALSTVVREEPEFESLGAAATVEGAEAFLDDPRLKVLLVNLSLASGERTPAPGVAFIRHAKERRPDVGILSLKRGVDEPLLRAALDAGADACCLATTPFQRLKQAVKAVAAGATWLDPEISRVLLHPKTRVASVHLSPRERVILGLIVDGYSNTEIAAQLGSATGTIHTHVIRLFRKLGVRDRVTAAVFALRGGLL
jgi:DNA-binding NarL/FixJ family response regulator